MDCIYHSCFRKNVNGTNRITGPNETCLVPSIKLCWKYIEDIIGGVKTRVSTKNNVREFDTFFRNKDKEDMERWETALDSEVRILKPTVRIYVI